MPQRPRTASGTRLLAIVATLLVLAGLKWSAPVTLPLAFAVFLIALFWPLQVRLQHRLGRGAGTLITLVVFLAAVGAFVGALWYAVAEVAEQAPKFSGELQRYREQFHGWAQRLGLADATAGGNAYARQASEAMARQAVTLVSAFVLVVAWFVLGLLEVRDYRDKLRRVSDADWFEPTRRAAANFQRYFIVRTAVGLVTGALVWLAAWLIGLEFAFVWGLLNFVLNYIPTIGSIVAVVPPVLFALLQFQSLVMAALVLAVIGGVQLIMGNFVDPRVQGRYLSLSPLVVLVAVVFWGWLWGPAGALIGVPITVAVVIATYAFPQTRWIAVLLARPREPGSQEPDDQDPGGSKGKRNERSGRAAR